MLASFLGKFLTIGAVFLQDPIGCRIMDKIDRKLLALVQRNNRLTTAELGDRVGLSATSCQRRLNRLRETGVIEKEVALLSPAAVGRPLLLIVEVLMERESTEPIDRFKRLVAASDEVCQCYYVTGRATFLLLLSMQDMAEYDRFIRRNFFDNPDVKTFETSVVIDRVKAGFELPLR